MKLFRLQAKNLTYRHPGCAGPPLSRRCVRKGFSKRRPPVRRVLYEHPKLRAQLIYLLSVIIRQIAGGKRRIILSADADPLLSDSPGLGYGSFKVKFEIQPCCLCPLHTLWRRRSRPAEARRSPRPPLLLRLLGLLRKKLDVYTIFFFSE